MLQRILAVSVLLAASLAAALPARAAYFASLIYDMPAGQSFIARAVLNDTRRTNLYTLSAYRIDRPGNGDEQRITGGEKDLLYAPLRFTAQPGSTEYFKLYYRGPADNVERYYRVDFK